MQTISLPVDRQGRITLPNWLKNQFVTGSLVQVLIDDRNERSPQSKSVKDNSTIVSGFGMLKTHLPAIDTDFDVAVFAKDDH